MVLIGNDNINQIQRGDTIIFIHTNNEIFFYSVNEINIDRRNLSTQMNRVEYCTYEQMIQRGMEIQRGRNWVVLENVEQIVIGARIQCTNLLNEVDLFEVNLIDANGYFLKLINGVIAVRDFDVLINRGWWIV